jgi:hypothetical protein
MADASLPALPRHAAVFGLTLFASIALPLFGGVSVLEWLTRIFGRDPVGAVMALLTFGSPFLFGLAVAVAGVTRDRDVAAALIKFPLALVHAMLALYAVFVARVPGVPLRWSFVGFAVVACIYFIYAHAEAEAADRPLGPRWLARWGGVVLAGAGVWLQFQTFGHHPAGSGLYVALAAAVLLAVAVPREPARPPAD